ncbi:MAG: cag pathogenicity island Cag12 family protein [Sulfurimonas sp.]|jgi:cag pathogenicity island protein 12|uniref:cag pathogenicity island Cag12 family protein n=1 Tax=Sulfurimonas sp. TaxID=2022749 RepID=UPI0035657A56
MEKIRLFGAAALAVFLSACSSSLPQPESVKSWDQDTTINHSLLKQNKSVVPKDPFLKNAHWAYKIKVNKRSGDLFTNEQIVKVFLVAHNASQIVIIGPETLAYEYKRYFVNNGVAAKIEIEPSSSSYAAVDILFFN